MSAVAVPAADGATFVVGRGPSAARVVRPGVHVDEWSTSLLSGSVRRSHGVVLAWTEVTRARSPRRWWWRTYTSFCSAGRCSRPVRALQSVRAVRRTPENAASPWQVYVKADETRDRTVVKAGVRWGRRWAITSRTRLVGRGPTENVWNGGFPGITHTPDGRDWVSWNDERKRIRVSQARNGQPLGGPVVGRGDVARVRSIGGRWVVLSLGRTDDEDVSYPVNLKTATTLSGLRRARPTRLAELGQAAYLSLYGPDDGPILAVWESITDIRHVRPVGHGAWIDRTGTRTATQTLPDEILNDNDLHAVPTPDGGLLLCPGGLKGSLGGPLQTERGAPCNDDEITPVVLKGGSYAAG